MNVIVKPARADDIQISCLPGLAWSEKPHAVEFRTVGVLRMRVAVHLVIDRVVVDECHLTAGLHRQRLRVRATRRDGDGHHRR